MSNFDEAYENLINHWAKFDFADGEERFHPDDDSEYLQKLLERCKKNERDENGRRLSIYAYLPQPFYGDLKGAGVYFLFVNPSLDLDNIKPSSAEKEAWKRNYAQIETEKPFVPINATINPGAAKWWNKKLAPLIKDLKRRKYSDADICSLIHKNICGLELFPYTSRNFNTAEAVKVAHNVKSAMFITRFAHELVNDEKKLLIVFRGNAGWDIKGENVVRYTGSFCQAASLNSRIDTKNDVSIKENSTEGIAVVDKIADHLLKIGAINSL
jgi:hypothetical protein